ncbi:MAG TPA: cation:proton antiporter [Thermoanaerobaculia bacterium]|nr:cation:proton antiporter [Thermoanaerobaculia bacterium]
MDHSSYEVLLQTVCVAVFLGMAAQVVADRFKLPAILPLLLFGMAAGPFGFAILQPSSLGEGLEVFIKLGVAIILFEGGLSLDPRQLRRVGAAVRNLLTVGVLVTGVLGAWLARVVLDLPWSTSALFGAIVTVTGPTVIVPLLRHMIAPRRVRTILVSEGLIVDPIGAVLAYLVLQWIERADRPTEALALDLLVLAATGGVLGFVGGSIARYAMRTRLVGRELRNLVILALLVGVFVLAELQAPESGILAAVVMGLVLSYADIPDLEPLRAFKEQLTVLFISMLFILLSGQLDLRVMAELGWRGLLVAAGLILLVRPLAVAASVWPGQLGWRERLMLGLTGPRGIVAAAVASLSAIQLREGGVAGAQALEGLVYLVILVTCLWATAMAVVLPRLLGYTGDPSRRQTVLVGANALSVLLADMLREQGRKVVVVDAVGWKLEPLRRRDILTVRGDARDASTYEEAGVERDTQVLALTTNDELNLLVAELVREGFGVEHPVVALQRPSEEFGRVRRAWIDLLGARGLDVPRWIRRLEGGDGVTRTVPVDTEQARLAVRELARPGAENALLVCGWAGGNPDFRPDLDTLDRFDRVTLIGLEGHALDSLDAVAEPAGAEPAEEIVADAEAEEDDDGGAGARPG